MNKDGVKRHCSQVTSCTITEETVDKVIQARIFATKLFAADVEGSEVKTIINQARKYYSLRKISEFRNKTYQSFEYVLSEALILIKEYDEALFYIDETIEKEKRYVFSEDFELKQLESIYLFKAIALANKGELKKSKEVLDSITTSNFYFLSKQFNLILYLSLKQRFKNSDALQYQIDYCIKETGFKRLIFNHEPDY